MRWTTMLLVGWTMTGGAAVFAQGLADELPRLVAEHMQSQQTPAVPAPTPAVPAQTPAAPPETGNQPAPAANRAPVVRARCEPCTVDIGGMAMVRAEAKDPDGDPLTFSWSVNGGTIANTRAGVTEWHAEAAPGFVIATVVVEDGRGGRVSDGVTIEVRDTEDVGFDEVQFDFDRDTLRPDVRAVLDTVISTMKAAVGMRLVIEGHTCDLGASEYNRELGERRARSVHDYLVRNGIDAARLSTISYGEEMPSYDNIDQARRALNRRAVLLVNRGEESGR